MRARHIDTAEYYKNEVEVGNAVRESGVPREDVFVSELPARPCDDPPSNSPVS